MKKERLIIVGLSMFVLILGAVIFILLNIKITPSSSVGIKCLGMFQKTEPGYKYIQNKLCWCPGTRHPDYLHVYAGVEENSWMADYGYAFESEGNLQVKWIPDQVMNGMNYIKTGEQENTYLIRKNCEQCGARGFIYTVCYDCNGNGVLNNEINCINCNGGKIQCTICGGNGEIPCQISFQNCSGKCYGCENGIVAYGGFKCFLCNGTGICSRCNGKKSITCACQGAGFWSCRLCAGKGAIIQRVGCRTCAAQKQLKEICETCKGIGNQWIPAPEQLSEKIELMRQENSERMAQYFAERLLNGENNPPHFTQNQTNESNGNTDMQDAQKQQLQAQLQAMQMQLLLQMIEGNAQLNQAIYDFGNSTSSNVNFSGNTSSYNKRTCSVHGIEYSLGVGGCPMCSQPDFGSGKTDNAKCSIHGFWYDPAIGCPGGH